MAAQGYKKVKSADISKISDDKEQLGTIENIKCDCICVSGFWTPTIHLASQSGNKTQFKEEIDAFIPGESKQNEKTLGAANGIYTLDETLKSSFEVGNEISKKITNKENKVSFPNVVTDDFGGLRLPSDSARRSAASRCSCLRALLETPLTISFLPDGPRQRQQERQWHRL